MTKIVAEKIENPRVSLRLLGAISFMVMADMRVVDPLLRIIANDFRTTVGNTAAIISAYTIPYGLFQWVYGPLGDRIGKLKVMTMGIAIFAIGTALCAFVPNLPLLIFLRFLTGMFAAAWFAGWYLLLIHHHLANLDTIYSGNHPDWTWFLHDAQHPANSSHRTISRVTGNCGFSVCI